MLISDEKKINEVQAEFKILFPHLQLRFYKKAHASGEGSKAREELARHLTIGEIRQVHNSSDLTIRPAMKVDELEQTFENELGLHVQVFRQSTGGLWLQTTATDQWTLGQQNSRASALLLNS